MEDNSCSDDEIKDSPLDTNLSSKKLKLNDGSSQESMKETAASGSKDENGDSGVSADKSESTSSDDRGAATVETPANELVTTAPSGSNVRAILLNVRHPMRSRRYRRRKTPNRDITSDTDSSEDSDDPPSIDESPPRRPEGALGGSTTEYSDSSFSTSTFDTSDSSNSLDSNHILHIQSEIGNAESPWFLNTPSGSEAEENAAKVPPVLLKTQPKHKYQIMRGRLLASGSDDTNVIIWDWAKKSAMQIIRSGHKSNVFQSKFLYLNARSQLNVVTCARDGQVRLLQCPPSGGFATRRRLASHKRAAHKLHVSPAEPHVVVSAGEDGLVIMCDVRVEHCVKNFEVCSFPLYSMAGHPLNKDQLLLAGQDKFVQVYDTRRASQPVASYCPGHFADKPVEPATTKGRRRKSTMHLTCAVYNHDGSQILGSYNDDDIYLFDATKDVYSKDASNDGKDGYTHRYGGHRNIATFKGVSFFGPKSEYIVSGSDCSYIYIWDKETESIVQWMEGDSNGVVNCIETHPKFPVMATSGLDKDIKIWIPKREEDPTYDGMKQVVRENSYTPRSPLFNDFLPSLYSAWRGENRAAEQGTLPPYESNMEFDGNVCTAF